MSDWVFGHRSLSNLSTVHPDLVMVMIKALDKSPLDFAITCGKRTAAEQLKLVKSGASRTMLSRHLTGHAVDIVVFVKGKVSWDWEYYDKVAQVVLAAAKELKVDVIWGGSWESFRDGPHFELDKRKYN